MSVGETLAEARSRAGLSVDQLSERTRIRTAVILCIEQDDYDACGGDVFVRGYVRALAGAVGIDPRPLIREYNRARVETPGEANVTHVARIANQFPPADAAALADVAVGARTAGTATKAAAPAADPRPADVAATAADQRVADSRVADSEATATDLPIVPAEPALRRADPEVTAADLPFVADDPAPTVADLPVIPAEPVPPSQSPQAGIRPRPRGRKRRRVAWVVLPSVLALAVAGVAIGLVASSQSSPPARNTAAFSQHASHAAQSPSSAATSPSAPPTSATPTPTPTPPSTPAPAVITALPIADAAAFGPAGLADGDNEQTAQNAIRAGSSSAWESQWYATPQFGDLKKGTGLLIDMGRTVTITSVRINLAGYGGANLQLRVGNPDSGPDGMRVAAQASDVGGTVQLTLSPREHVRYLLIWFTLLPPNGAGDYQASVYHVVVDGYT